MRKFIELIDKFCTSVWFIICIVLALCSFVWKALYNMNDYPYFEYTKAIDIMLIVLLLYGYYALFKYSDYIERKMPYYSIVLFFALVGIAFIVLLPINPISDPVYVVDGALALAKGDMEYIYNSNYLQSIVKNLKVSSFYALFCSILPKNVMSLRALNVCFYILTAFGCGKIVKNIFGKYEKISFIFIASFIPLIIYTNHVYFDLPVLCLCTLALWSYSSGKNTKNIIMAAIFLGVAGSLRVSALIMMLAIVLDYCIYSIKNKQKKRIIIFRNVFMYVGIVILILWMYSFVINSLFRAEDATDESIWSLFWMGINEPEFGMMHNEYFVDGGYRTFDDFWNLLTSRSLIQNMKLFGRKILWTWTQGTYQCQRYGFGYDVSDILGKFIYDTPLTSHFANTSQIMPLCIIELSRAQYMVFWILMIIGIAFIIYNKEYDKFRMFIYAFGGTALVLFFYEMKSRYVFHLITCMVILAVKGLVGLKETHTSSALSFCTVLRKLRSQFIITGIVFACVVISATYINKKDERQRLAYEAKKNAATQLCTDNGLTILERTYVIPNIKEDYYLLYIADIHAVVPTMDMLPAWGIATEDRIEGFRNAVDLKSNEQFSRWIQVANIMEVDALLLGGDIIDYKNDENINWLQSQLNSLKVPYIYTLGNHDAFDIYNNVQDPNGEKFCELFLNKDMNCSYIDFGDFIVCQVNDAYNSVSEDTLEEFKYVYDIGKPMILLLHIPLYSEKAESLRDTTRAMWGDDFLFGFGLDYELDYSSQEFLNLVLHEDSPVIMTLAGHVHFSYENMLNENILQHITGSASSGQAYLIHITQ